MTDYSKQLDINREDLKHIHLRDEDSTKSWYDDNDELVVQWECTSDTFIIYSHFVKDTTRYYYIVDILYDTGHDDIKNSAKRSMWIDETTQYRISITNSI